MDGEIDTTTKSRWLSLYEIMDVNTHGGECPSMVCRNKKLYSHGIGHILLARFQYGLEQVQTTNNLVGVFDEP